MFIYILVLLYYTNTNHLLHVEINTYVVYIHNRMVSRSEIVIESTLLHMSSAVFGYSIIILAYTLLNTTWKAREYSGIYVMFDIYYV